MADLGGVPVIELLLRRLSRSKSIHHTIVATTERSDEEVLVRHLQTLGVDVFRGSERNVLQRFAKAAAYSGADVIVRITGDCPLVDPEIVDSVVAPVLSGDVQYCSNIDPPTYPDGLDVEAFSVEALTHAASTATSEFDKEHVTPFLRASNLVTRFNIESGSDFSGERWTLDDPADLEVLRAIRKHFGDDDRFGWREVLDLRRAQPWLFAKNQHTRRNEGAAMNSGQKLWKRAKVVIPGGSMLLSKRAEMFLPDQWPAYFSRAKGCRVWDLDGRELIDASLMGIGTNTLGYGHPEVDAEVLRVVRDGNMSTLNAPEEVALAERLVSLHPWSHRVRFARTGGEANAIAVRIGRAAAGKSKVAVCGYHGWHDWYLSANLGDESNLAGHLLPGLEPAGVPGALRGSTLAFNYGNIEQLEAIVAAHDVGVIKLEVARSTAPDTHFLRKVREIATREGIVLIFDECTSGFRQTYGGLHLEVGVEPDIAVFGKTLGNGYAITAVIGRTEVMEAAQSSFISSTFWTERIGSAAALRTLDVMERVRSWDQIKAIGSSVVSRWKDLASEHGLSIATNGLPALSTFSFEGANALVYKTLLTQEMLTRGFLASTAFYACTEHTSEVLDAYFVALSDVFQLIAECEGGRDPGSLLKGPVCHAGFRRLN